MSKDNNQEVFTKTSINWYPGHMAKTKRLIKENMHQGGFSNEKAYDCPVSGLL